MQVRSPALVCSVRPHGETAAIVRLLTEENGMIAAYVAGGRGRQMRPVLIPGNVVDAEINARSPSQLPWARVELVQSRGPWLGEPLPAAAITWLTALTAAVLPERHPYVALFQALGAALDAVCLAPSARDWLALVESYERLVLRELGYGAEAPRVAGDWTEALAAFDRTGARLGRYLLADHARAGKGAAAATAREQLRERLGRIGG